MLARRFSSDHVFKNAQRFQMNPEEVLDNIICARAHNSEQQLELLADAAALMSESRHALLVVDSATALYRTDYMGRGELSERYLFCSAKSLRNIFTRFAAKANAPRSIYAATYAAH